MTRGVRAVDYVRYVRLRVDQQIPIVAAILNDSMEIASEVAHGAHGSPAGTRRERPYAFRSMRAQVSATSGAKADGGKG